MNMKLTIGLYLMIVLFTQCAENKSNHFEQPQILGEWRLNTDQINYPLLRFDIDSSAVFSSRGDTIYYYIYYIKGDTLMLNNAYGGRIKTLTKEDLVFYDLLENGDEQVYAKEHD